MNDRDYIILFDDEGQPYISHSWTGIKTMASGKVSKGASGVAQGIGRGVRKVHKYILKVGEGANALYAYTQAEADALLGRGRQKVTQAAESIRQKGSSAIKSGREKLTSASTKIRDAAATVSENAKNFSSRTASTLKRHGSEMLSDIRKTTDRIKSGASETIEQAKDRIGLTARERRSQAFEKMVDEKAPKRTKDQVKQEFKEAKEEYSKTPLGKLEDAKTRVYENLTGQSTDYRDRIEDAVERAKDKVGTAVDSAKDAVSSIKDKAKETVEKVKDKTTVDEKAQELFDKLRSGASSAKDKVSEGVDKAKDTAKTAGEKAKETVEKVKDKAKDWAGYDEKERMEAAQKEFQDKYEEGLRLTEEREPIRKAYYDYDTEMFQKYGVNYEDKMTPSEKAKYDKLGKELSDISEKWWDATIRQMHSAAYRSDPTLRDKLDDAIAEYQNTPLGMLDKLKRK